MHRNNISTSTTRSGTRFSRVQSETETEIETATNLISNQSQQAIATKTSNKDVSNDGADKRNNTKDESVGKEITANSETNSYNETLLKVMTDEVTCSICMDIIVKATVSNPCGHLFCARCLKRALSNTECCPVCRTRITSRTRSIAIDNIIRSMAMRGDFTISDFQNYLARSSTKLSKKEVRLSFSKIKLHMRNILSCNVNCS